MKLHAITGLFAAMTLAANVPALADCPARITSAVRHAYPNAKVLSCTAERDEGTMVYEVRIRIASGKTIEMDVSPEGNILVTEEAVAVKAIPRAVLRALLANFEDATITDADRLTYDDGEILYELTFAAAGERHEMTVTEAGLVLDIDDEEVDDEDATESDDNDT
jgi:uncharacterized membrane protein YkoI